ncbi:MAG: hypothetical protein WCH61_01260 [bacterium]
MENSIPSRAEESQFCVLPWFLASGVLNTVFVLWTFGGSVFLRFLNELGLPKGQIGAVLALFPFCGVLALGFAPVATHWGWKRVFLLGYGIRKVVMALLLLLPCCGHWPKRRFQALLAAGRLLFNCVIPPEQSTAYTAIHYAWLGMVGGIAPLLAGTLLTTCGDGETSVGGVMVDGHHLLFGNALLLLAAGWWLYGRVRPDDRHTDAVSPE